MGARRVDWWLWHSEPPPEPDAFEAPRLWAANWPTTRQLWEFNAPGAADTILQIVRRDAAYRGLGTEVARDHGDRPTPARDRYGRAHATRQA